MGMYSGRLFGAGFSILMLFALFAPAARADEGEASAVPDASDTDVPPIVAAATNPPSGRRPLLLSLAAEFQKGVSTPQNNRFGPGLSVAFSAEYPVLPWLLVGGRVRGGFLFDGPAPADPNERDPGYGYQALLMPSARFRPLGRDDTRERGTGFFADLAIGGGVSDGDGVAAVEVGLGYMFRVGLHDAGPTFRYLHLIEPNGNDLSLLTFGVLLTFNDERDEVVVEEPVMTWTPSTRARDTDHDGLVDASDECPREAEDMDGFHDDDGCPDFDDDDDGILDRDDACDHEAEDTDGHEDEDGCPDPDNDGDSVFDDADECPDAREVVNGVDDLDGCPDEGVIELVSGRFTLEDRLLFTGNQARLGRNAQRIVAALVAVAEQHPEWVSVTVESHIEARGNTARNQTLTEQRAEALRAALIAGGVPEARVRAVGRGATAPREGTANPASRRHRRVEVVIETPRTAAPSAE